MIRCCAGASITIWNLKSFCLARMISSVSVDAKGISDCINVLHSENTIMRVEIAKLKEVNERLVESASRRKRERRMLEEIHAKLCEEPAKKTRSESVENVPSGYVNCPGFVVPHRGVAGYLSPENRKLNTSAPSTLPALNAVDDMITLCSTPFTPSEQPVPDEPRVYNVPIEPLTAVLGDGSQILLSSRKPAAAENAAPAPPVVHVPAQKKAAPSGPMAAALRPDTNAKRAAAAPTPEPASPVPTKVLKMPAPKPARAAVPEPAALPDPEPAEEEDAGEEEEEGGDAEQDAEEPADEEQEEEVEAGEEEEELEEYTHRGVEYYVNSRNRADSAIYAKLADEDVGEVVGNFVKGVFTLLAPPAPKKRSVVKVNR